MGISPLPSYLGARKGSVSSEQGRHIDHDGYHSICHRKAKILAFMPHFSKAGTGTLDLPRSSGKKLGLPHWAVEGNSPPCPGAKVNFNIPHLHISQPTLMLHLLCSPWYCWHPPSRLGVATRNFPDRASGTSIKLQTSGWGQHISESKQRGDFQVSTCP